MSRTIVLTRHFFNRLFQNEVFPFEDQMKERLYFAGAFLAIMGGFVSNSLLMKYMFWADNLTSWQEQTFFLSFFMAALAIIVVLDWDILFPDPRDYANLMVLPIRLRMIFGTKFLSFLVFIGLYTAAVNAVAIFVVALFLPKWRAEGDVGFLLLYVAAHLLAAAAAFLFVFFLFVFVHAALLLLLPPRLFKKVSLLLRFSVLSVLAFGLMAFIVQSPVLARFSAAVLAAKEAGAAHAAAIPPLWFVGLYETLLGNPDPVFHSLAGIAVRVTPALALAYFAAMGLAYRRHIRKTSESDGSAAGMRVLRDRAFGWIERLASRDRIEQAVLRFTAEGLRASTRHRIQIAGFIALALGLDMIFLTSTGPLAPGSGLPVRAMLSAPLVVAFFAIVSLRLAFAVPISAEANWVFRITAGEKRAPYHAGRRKAVVAFAVVPIAVATAAVYSLIWPLHLALLHAAYVLVSSLLLMEAVFRGFAKIPFACLSVPGKSKLQFYWPFYVLGFLFYIGVFGSMERSFFASRSGFPVFFGVAGILLAALWVFESKRSFERIPIVFEEEPGPVMISLSMY